MAIFHLSARIVTRGDGRSAVAAAAYRSGTCMTNEWGGTVSDYTRKMNILHTEIMLPPHAPVCFQDRATLWNSVEASETSIKAQLAREVEVALPIELPFDQQLELVRNYVQKNFVAKGMCADFAIHNPAVLNEIHQPIDLQGNPTKDPDKMVFRNPHAHILLTMRALNPDGTWAAKGQKGYVCRKGDEELTIPPAQMEAAYADGWRKQFSVYLNGTTRWMTEDELEANGIKLERKEPKSRKLQNPITEEWNSRDTLHLWRDSWASICNHYLELNHIDTRITSASYEDQMKNEVPSVHMGATATYMERKGNKTELGELNKMIQADNQNLKTMEKEIEDKKESEHKRLQKVAEKLVAIRSRCISSSYRRLLLSGQSVREQDKIQTQMEMLQANGRLLEELQDTLGQLERENQKVIVESKSLLPFQYQKRKEIQERITGNEVRIKQLKERMTEVEGRMEELQKGSQKSGGLQEQLNGIEELKEERRSLYQEFYSLVHNNKEETNEIRQLIDGLQNQSDQSIETDLQQKYKGEFSVLVFQKAIAEAPTLDVDRDSEDGFLKHRI